MHEVPQLPSEVWSLILARCDTWGLRVAGCVSSSLAAQLAADGLWLAMHSELLGTAVSEHSVRSLEDSEGQRLSSRPHSRPRGVRTTDEALASPRARCIESELAISQWTRAIGAAPRELQLPGMVAVSLAGEVGVSAHEGRMTRLWEGSSGRRVACYQHRAKHDLVCCDASSRHAAVGDASGAVHIFELEEDFVPQQTLLVEGGPADAASPVSSVLLLGEAAAARALCAFGRSDGMVRVHEVLPGCSSPLPIWSTFLADAPLFPLGLAKGMVAELYVASRLGVAQYDLERAAPVWEATWADDGVDAPPQPFSGHPAGRTASYSVGWRILAAVSADGDVGLYDTRASAASGAVARIAPPCGTCALSVHLDGGHRSSGHVLLSSIGRNAAGRPSGGVHLYDIRRVVAASRARSLRNSARPLATPLGTVSGGACFAADDARLVWGGGQGDGRAFVASLSQVGDDACASEEEALDHANGESQPMPKARTRRPRGTKKEWSH